MRVPRIQDIAEQRLCCGCGACAYIRPEQIRMVDIVTDGRRPLVSAGFPQHEGSVQAGQVCPGVHLQHTFDRRDPALMAELVDGWGPVREVWEGHAADPEIRFAGSSGGAASALALYCIEELGFHGVLHIAARRDVPYLNETVMSRTREELLSRTGSRYAPASPCDGLQMIEDAPGPCVFIGKPCDVAAVQKARRLRPELDRKVGLTIAFFCAGVPSTQGTLDLLRLVGVEDPATVESLRYRGNGWPGRWTVCFRDPDGSVQERSLSYEESWGFLTKYKQWRCKICPDHTGEFADIAVADSWYKLTREGTPGRSIIVCRTERGLRVLRSAAKARCLDLERSTSEALERSQPSLLTARAALWGRLHTLRLLGQAVPVCSRMQLASLWWSRLTFLDKIHSVFGTARRVLIRYWKMYCARLAARSALSTSANATRQQGGA